MHRVGKGRIYNLHRRLLYALTADFNQYLKVIIISISKLQRKLFDPFRQQRKALKKAFKVRPQCKPDAVSRFMYFKWNVDKQALTGTPRGEAQT